MLPDKGHPNTLSRTVIAYKLSERNCKFLGKRVTVGNTHAASAGLRFSQPKQHNRRSPPARCAKFACAPVKEQNSQNGWHQANAAQDLTVRRSSTVTNAPAREPVNLQHKKNLQASEATQATLTKTLPLFFERQDAACLRRPRLTAADASPYVCRLLTT